MAQDSALDIWTKHVEEGGLKALGSPVFTAPEAMSKEEEWLFLADMGSTKGMVEGFQEGGLMEAIPFASHFAEGGVTDAKKLDKAIADVRAGTASQEQFMLVVDDMRERSRPVSAGYVFAKGLKSTAAFGGEIALAGPVAGLGRALGTKAIAKMGVKWGLAGRVGGAMAGEAARMVAIDSGKYGLDWLFGEGEAWSPADVEAFRRGMPEFELDATDDGRLQLVMTDLGTTITGKKFEALTKGYIELISERLGPTLGAAFKKLPLGGKIMALEQDFFRWARGKGYAKSVDDLARMIGKKAEYHTAIEEWLEERAGAALSGAAPWMEETLAETVPSFEQGLGEFLAAAAPGGLRAGLGRTFGQSEADVERQKDDLLAGSLLSEVEPKAPIIRQRLEEKRAEIQKQIEAAEDPDAPRDLTGDTPSPGMLVEDLASLAELEALSDEELEKRYSPRSPSEGLTQPGEGESVAQEALEREGGLRDRAAQMLYNAEFQKLVDGGASEEEAAEQLKPRIAEFFKDEINFVDAAEDDQEVVSRFEAKAKALGIDIRWFSTDSGEEAAVPAMHAGEGVVLLDYALLQDEKALSRYLRHESIHDVGAKWREKLDRMIDDLREWDPVGFAKAIDSYQADVGGRVARGLLLEEGAARRSEELDVLLDYLESDKGMEFLERLEASEDGRTRLQGFVDFIRALLKKFGLGKGTVHDRQLAELSEALGDDVSAGDLGAARSIQGALEAIRGKLAPSQRPGVQQPKATEAPETTEAPTTEAPTTEAPTPPEPAPEAAPAGRGLTPAQLKRARQKANKLRRKAKELRAQGETQEAQRLEAQAEKVSTETPRVSAERPRRQEPEDRGERAARLFDEGEERLDRYAAASKDRPAELQAAAARIKDAGDVTQAEYQTLVNKHKPVRPYAFIPEPATVEEMRGALGKKGSKIGAESTLKEGTLTGIRLDIPAYTRHGVWVPTIHQGKKSGGAGPPVAYASVAALKNPKFSMSEKTALKIAAGGSKDSFAVITGEWRPITPEAAKREAERVLNDPAWVQVGMDPIRHSFFYDRRTQVPVISAEEAIQVGPLVLAKNPVFAKASDYRFAVAPRKGDVGGFSYERRGDTLFVGGDRAEIRSKLPKHIRGRPVLGGLQFTPLAAERVFRALEGEMTAYSRAGRVMRHAKDRETGEYLGAPRLFNTSEKVGRLRKWLRQLTNEGAAGRFWYENSGRAVLRMVGGDLGEARKFVALLSIYSPQAKVDTNGTFALRAWAQYKAGHRISVRTGATDAKAEAALRDVDAFWSGEKTGNFYINLLREIDPSYTAQQGATIDMWMMRAASYDNDAPNDHQYRFMEIELNRIAREVGWEPQQVQAAIWVAMKSRMENPGVKERTEARSEKHKWISFRTDEVGRRVRVIHDKFKHRKNWLNEARKHSPEEADTALAKFDFEDALQRHIGQVSWEARPGRSTGILPGIHDAPWEQQLEFQQAVQRALMGPNGEDLLAQRIGLLVEDSNLESAGVWQGEVSPVSQRLIPMAPGKGKPAQIDIAQQELLSAYASVLGLLTHQEGVGWHKPIYKKHKYLENGVEIGIGRTFTPEEARKLWDALDRAIGTPDWNDSIGLISSPNGMRVVRLPGEGETRGDLTALNKKHRGLVRDIIPRLSFEEDVTVTAEDFGTDGDLITNDWQENPNGEIYRSRVREAGLPDLLGWSASVLAPRVEAVLGEFSERYGWGDAGPRGRFAATRRAQGFFGGEQAAEAGVRFGGGVRGGSGVLDGPRWPHLGPDEALTGLPPSVTVDGRRVDFGPSPVARGAAESYADQAGIAYRPPTVYASVDEERARRIAQAFEAMAHDPANPEVAAAYDALIRETLAQWEAIKATGLRVEFNPDRRDPYGNPRNALLDIKENNHLFIFPTDDGFGSEEDASSVLDSPMLAPTGQRLGGREMLANDVFRIVHDYFGHYKEGVGFRARGEENAWQQHMAMFSEEAQRAITTETRGQNSWVNFGPFGEQNKAASGADTVYAPQKVGLLPANLMLDGYLGGRYAAAARTDTPAFKRWFGDSKVVDAEGKPLVVYRGVQRPEELKGLRALPSFTEAPDIASTYAAVPGDWMTGRDAAYRTGASVFPVYLSVQNPLDLGSGEGQMSFDEYLGQLQHGQPEGMTDDEARKAVNYLINRSEGRAKAQGEFKYEAPFHDPGLSLRTTTLREFREAMDFEGPQAVGEDLVVDVYVLADAPVTRKVAERLGYDGIAHMDVFGGRRDAAQLLGKEPEAVEGLETAYDAFEDTQREERHITYRPFRPEQIKSATGNRGTFDPTNPDIRFAVPRTDQMGFFSQAEKAALDSPQKKYAKAQVRPRLKKYGTKDEELDWMGLDEWLKGLPKGHKVTQEELLAFIRENAVVVGEKVLGRGRTLDEKEKLAARREAVEREAQRYSVAQIDEDAFGVLDPDGVEVAVLESREWAEDELLGRARASAPAGPFVAEPEPTRHGSYQEPGGENYRELLLTLPESEEPFDPGTAQLPEGIFIEHDGLDWFIAQRGAGRLKKHPFGSELRARHYYWMNFQPAGTPGRLRAQGAFQGPHYDEPNVLAHIRFNERTDAEGKRVLFIEEIQSDWHQAGREKGYQGSAPLSALPEGYSFKHFDNGDVGVVEDSTGSLIATGLESEGEVLANFEEFIDPNRVGKRVPDAPFKTSWPTLALKRMIRWAAENNFDSIAWTTGAMQVGRYETSYRASVRNMAWRPTERGESGSKDLDIFTPQGLLELEITERGMVKATQPELDGKPLEDIVGKEIARQILTEDSGNVGGEGLTIGGKGMTEFYDKRLVSTANKLGKPFGAKVGLVGLEERGLDAVREHRAAAESFLADGQTRSAALEGLASAYPDASQQALSIAVEKVYGRPVPSLPITQEMRESVTQVGFERFAAKRTRRPGDRARAVRRPQEGARTFNLAMEDEELGDRLRRLFQDEFLRMMRLEQNIGDVSVDESVYEAMGAATPRMRGQVNKLTREFKEPIYEELRVIVKGGDTLEDATSYLLARGAPSRNEEIARRNREWAVADAEQRATKKAERAYRREQGGGPWEEFLAEYIAAEPLGVARFQDVELDPGSGTPTSEAEETVRERESGPLAAHYKGLGKLADRMNTWALKYRLDAGLLTQEQFDRYQSQWDHYMPHKTDTDVSPYATGGGFSVKGKEFHTAGGRETVPDAPLQFAFQQAYQSIHRGESNRVGLEFLKLLRDNAEAVEFSESMPEDYVAPEQLEAGQLALKEDGVQVIISLADDKLARAMNRVGHKSLPHFMRWVNKAVRFWVATRTSLSPQFMLKNLIKDAVAGQIHITSEQSYDLAARVRKGTANAIATGYAVRRGNIDRRKPAHKEFLEYEAAGGLIGWYYTPTIDELGFEVKSLEREVSPTPLRKAATPFVKAFAWVEDANHAIENGTRFSLYREMRKDGYSPKEAATAARKVTVDFTKKGELSSITNVAWIFSNAGLQGNHKTLVVLGTKRGKQFAMGFVASGFSLAMYNILAAGDDDDGTPHLLRIPEHIRNTHIVFVHPEGDIPIPGGGGYYFKIPLPYGWSTFWALGVQTAEVAFTNRKVLDAAGSFGRAALDSWNPMGTSPSWAQTFSPTLTDPLIQLWTNENWAGSPIMKEQPAYGYEIPDSQRHFKSVSTVSKKLAQWANKLTGGDEIEPGFVDVSPETLDHFYEFLTGSAGKFLERTLDLPLKLVNGEVPSVSEVPMLSVFLGEPSEWFVSRTYYAHRDNLERLKDRVELYTSERNPKKVLSLKRNNATLWRARERFKEIDKRIRELRQKMRPLPEAKREPYLKMIDGLQRRANKLLADA